jgi:CO/xanthine dehydrogenase FAD-binding subunit
MKLDEGEFISQIIIEEKYKYLEHAHVKRTKQDKIDYPLITLAAMKEDNKVKVAFSGLCEFPFRSLEVENSLNDCSYSLEDRLNNALLNLPQAILNDDNGSSEYRRFVFENIIRSTFRRLEG